MAIYTKICTHRNFPLCGNSHLVFTVHCKNGIVIMTYSLSFWLQMSEPITHMDTDNYIMLL